MLTSLYCSSAASICCTAKLYCIINWERMFNWFLLLASIPLHSSFIYFSSRSFTSFTALSMTSMTSRDTVTSCIDIIVLSRSISSRIFLFFLLFLWTLWIWRWEDLPRLLDTALWLVWMLVEGGLRLVVFKLELGLNDAILCGIHFVYVSFNC